MLTTNTDAIGGTMPSVLSINSMEEKGEMSRLSSFVGAISVADLVKSTLGPKGMVRINF
jgi:T-complex protein 1 subunit beta